jgi:uncharacterized protein (UPF0261 family)
VAEPRTVAVIATLDTKGREAAFVRECLIRKGLAARLVDVGMGDAPQCALAEGDVAAADVAAAAGTTLAALRASRRDEGMAAMGFGAAAILRASAARGGLAGAIGLGGNQGTAVACTALRALPLGLPKVVVSTVASGNIRPYVGASDIAVIFSLADLLGGPNRITRGVLARAAGMLGGMIDTVGDQGTTTPGDSRPAVALTALGNTHAAAVRIMEALAAEGFDVVPFHASGAGGSAMERLIDAGMFSGVIDLTTHELLGELYPDDIYAPVEVRRLTAAGRRALPLVAAPGGLDYFIFGPPESVPAHLRDRHIHHHNPYNMNVIARADERAQVARLLARRLNEALGPAAFLYPRRGWSFIGRDGAAMWDPDAGEAFRRTLQGALRADRVRYVEVDADINDPRFADEIVRVYLELIRAAA